MKEIVNRLYTINISIDDPNLRNSADRWARIAERWDETDPHLELFRKPAEED